MNPTANPFEIQQAQNALEAQHQASLQLQLQTSQQFMQASSVICLILLACILLVLIWQAIATRRGYALQKNIAGQLGEVETRMKAVEKLLIDVG